MILKRSIILVTAFLFAVSPKASSQDHNSKSTKHQNGEKPMTMEQASKNKEAIRNLYENILNTRQLELLNELIADEYTGIRGEKGVAAFKESVVGLIKAFPDIQWTVEDLIAEGNKVMIRQKLQGTHRGQFQTFAATGKVISNTGIGVYEFKDGKIINHNIQTDRLGFLQALEVVPLDLSLLANNKERKGEVSFIDKFFVPANAKEEFFQRMNYNRDFIKALPGFVKDEVYSETDANENLTVVTIAVWKNETSLSNAKEAVKAEYERMGFVPAEFIQRLNIKLERGVFQKITP
jgi:predicted ester cyclase/heme-degrading monooxygenase HmoA